MTIIVILGFLGAGKTPLIKALSKQKEKKIQIKKNK